MTIDIKDHMRAYADRRNRRNSTSMGIMGDPQDVTITTRNKAAQNSRDIKIKAAIAKAEVQNSRLKLVGVSPQERSARVRRLKNLAQSEVEHLEKETKRTLQSFIRMSDPTSKSVIAYAIMPEIYTTVDEGLVQTISRKAMSPYHTDGMARLVTAEAVVVGKARAPVRTGALRESIYGDIDTLRFSNKGSRRKEYVIKLKSDLDYANPMNSGRRPAYGYIPPHNFLNMRVIGNQLVPVALKAKKAYEQRLYLDILKEKKKLSTNLKKIVQSDVSTQKEGEVGTVTPAKPVVSNSERLKRSSRSVENQKKIIAAREDSSAVRKLRQQEFTNAAQAQERLFSVADFHNIDPDVFRGLSDADRERYEREYRTFNIRERRSNRRRGY